MVNITDQRPSVRVAFRAWTLARLIALMYYGTLSIRAGVWLIVSPEVTKIAAKEQAGRATLDLFAHRHRPGRSKTNPLSCSEQPRINKHNQLKCDKVRGLKRIELKLNVKAVEALNKLMELCDMSRSELIKEMPIQQLAALRSQGIV